MSKRVKVTLMFDADDAGAFPSDDLGVLNQNLFNLLTDALICERWVKLIEVKHSPEKYTKDFREAHALLCEEDIRIGREMVDSMKVEVIE